MSQRANFNIDTSQVKWERITEAKTKKMRRVLFATGRYAMRVADRLIRKAGKRGGRAHVSKPGSPPKYHVKPGLKGNFMFDVSMKKSSVTVGPREFGQAKRTVIPHAASGAELLELGGSFTNTRTKKRFHMKARPYMAPTFEKTLPFFKKMLYKIPLK